MPPCEKAVARSSLSKHARCCHHSVYHDLQNRDRCALKSSRSVCCACAPCRLAAWLRQLSECAITLQAVFGSTAPTAARGDTEMKEATVAIACTMLKVGPSSDQTATRVPGPDIRPRSSHPLSRCAAPC